MTPVRIQLSRAKGFRLQEYSKELNCLYAVKVDRTTRWGNPYMAEEDPWGRWRAVDIRSDGLPQKHWTTKELALAFAVLLFENEMNTRTLNLGYLDELRSALAGRNLACWCKPGTPCHGDVLLRIANAPDTERVP